MSGSDSKSEVDVRREGFVGTMKLLPNRFASLLFNLISRWGVMLGFTFYLLIKGHLEHTNALIGWLVFAILFLFKSDGIELIKDLVKSVKG